MVEVCINSYSSNVSSSSGSSSDHSVTPVSVAKKRMQLIVTNKATECSNKVGGYDDKSIGIMLQVASWWYVL